MDTAMKKLIILTVTALSLLFVTNASAQIVRGSSSVSSVSSAQKSKKGPKTGLHYQGELNFGYGLAGKLKEEGYDEKFDANYSRVFFETVNGVRINPYVFAGVGVGVQYSFDWENVTLPVFAALRGYYPVTDRFAPYVAVDLGYSPMLNSSGSDGGFYAAYGLGLTFGKLNFGFGWQHQTIDDEVKVNSFVVKFGLKF